MNENDNKGTREPNSPDDIIPSRQDSPTILKASLKNLTFEVTLQSNSQYTSHATANFKNNSCLLNNDGTPEVDDYKESTDLLPKIINKSPEKVNFVPTAASRLAQMCIIDT